MAGVSAVTLLIAACAAADSRIDRAVAKLRQGDMSAAGELIKMGVPAVKAVAPLLTDSREDVRRNAVAVLGALPGEESCKALGPALEDASHDIRARAALAYYHRCPLESVSCSRLLAGLGKGDPSAAALLLSGFCGEASRKFLEAATGRMKLESHGPVVDAKLVAAIARLRAGDASQVSAVAGAKTSIEDAEFILQALPVIPEQYLAHALPLVDDKRDARAFAGVPSGATPRRICDAAVDALAARLGVTLPFPQKRSARYTAGQLEAAKSSLQAKLTKN